MNKKNNTVFLYILISIFLLVSCNTNTPTNSLSNIIYVDINASGKNDGSSWENAYNSLVDALKFANPENDIWVAEGTYYPCETSDTSISFTMKDDVDIYGGFTGIEESLDQRDWVIHETILSGDIGIRGNSTDNSTKVVIAANNIIDGFTITGGYFDNESRLMIANASLDNIDNNRMGPPKNRENIDGSKEMLGPPPNGEKLDRPMGPIDDQKALDTLKNDMDISIDNSNDLNNFSTESSIQDNNMAVGHMTFESVMSGDATLSSNGNGIIIWEVAPTIVNCTIIDNNGSKGAGVYIIGTSDLDNIPTFINTIISNNTAEGRGGGVSIDMKSSAYFIDCIFDGNSCSNGKGGAIYNDYGGSPLLENCLFVNNFAQSGGAIANDGASNPIVSNCTFYNNTASEAAAALYQGSGPFNDPVIIDSIIWSNYCELDEVSIYNWNECNPRVEYSIVEGGYDGIGILDIDPMFIDPSDYNFSYSVESNLNNASHDNSMIGFDSDLCLTRSTEDYNTIKNYLNSIELNKEPVQINVNNPSLDSQIDINLRTLFVDISNGDEGDGSSWDTSFNSLQTAINTANAIYEVTGETVDIWVSKGTYYPGQNRSDSFILHEGVNIYGGFNGTEKSLSQRNYEKNITRLSGEIGDKNSLLDNSYHVLVGSDNALIDGFTISDGYADGVDGEVYDNKGGALINYLAGNRVRPDIEPTLGFDTELYNVIFINNYANEGGAVYTYHGGNPTFTNCSFINNSAKYGAAVLDRAGTNAIYTSCSFQNNFSIYKGGTAFCDYGSMQSFYNCEFIDNESESAAGAIYIIDRASQAIPNETDFDLIDETWANLSDIFSSVYIENCDFINNTAKTNGGAIYVYESGYAKIVDSTFINNTADDATVVANNSGKIFITITTTFKNNSLANTLKIGSKSSIVNID
ncbi:MAG: right-handed parallel beta-helix repeat-containing protein [Pleomorphochaeta sp.]